MKKLHILFLGLLLVMLAACSKILDNPGTLQQDEIKLVVNAVINPDTNIIVYVSRNYAIVGKTPDPATLVVRDAEVSVYEDGVLFETLIFKDTATSAYDSVSGALIPIGQLGYFGSDSKRPTPGKTYEVKVTHPTYGTASASTILPITPEINSVTILKDAILDENQEKLDLVTVKIGNISPLTPYLALSICGYFHQVFSDTSYFFFSPFYPAFAQNSGWKDVYYNSFSPNKQNQASEVYLIRASNELTQELKLYVQTPNRYNSNLVLDSTVVYVVGCDKPYYDYITRLGIHLESQDPGIAFFQGEKLPMLSNIKNGYGIWGGYTKKRVVIK